MAAKVCKYFETADRPLFIHLWPLVIRVNKSLAFKEVSEIVGQVQSALFNFPSEPRVQLCFSFGRFSDLPLESLSALRSRPGRLSSV